MLSPIVVPFPLALLFVVTFAAALHFTAERFPRIDAPVLRLPALRLPSLLRLPAAAPAGGRHRPENVALRLPVSRVHYDLAVQHGWPLTAAPVTEPYVPLWSQPTAELEIAGHDDREPGIPGPLRTIDTDTGELACVA